MAGPAKMPVGDPLGGLGSLMQLLGGTTTTTTSNPGNTAPLDSVMQQLQAQNNAGYDNLLNMIFQQAAGQIPGLQNAYANAVGARSGGNSAVKASLGNLLKQTSIEAQGQIVRQQNQNLQTQSQTANSIAQATKGTNQSQKTKTNNGDAAKLLGFLTLASKARGLFSDEDGEGGIAGSLQRAFGGGGTGTDTFSSPVQMSSASASELGPLDGGDAAIFEPTPLPPDFDTPLNLDELFGGDMPIDTGVDLGNMDFGDLGIGNNDDLGGWQDPMMDPNIDWSL